MSAPIWPVFCAKAETPLNFNNDWEASMNKPIRKFRGMSDRDDSSMTGHHIEPLRILGFAKEEITKFTEEEDSHFDLCRVCRLKLVGVLRNLTPEFTWPKAA
jgi:hypothetical protein